MWLQLQSSGRKRVRCRGTNQSLSRIVEHLLDVNHFTFVWFSYFVRRQTRWEMTGLEDELYKLGLQLATPGAPALARL